MRQAIGHPGDSRGEWQVLAELCKRAGADPVVLTAPNDFTGGTQVNRGTLTLASASSLSAQTQASARSGERVGPA